MRAILRRAQSVVALLALVVLAVIVSPVASDGSRIFLQVGNLTDILRQISLIGMISLAMTFVILTGGIDLSVGSILALSTALTAMLLTRAWPTMGYGGHIALAIATAVAASTLAGALNGIAIATLKVQPFIVTLAAMIGLRGLAKWLTNNENIDIGFGRDVAARFAEIFREKAIVIGAFAGAAAVFWTLLERMVFGRYVRAIGDNEKGRRVHGPADPPCESVGVFSDRNARRYSGCALRGGEPPGQSERRRGVRTRRNCSGGDRRDAPLRRQGVDFGYHRGHADYGRADEPTASEQRRQQCGDDDQSP